ncbi:hypothetical protein E2C01_044899 [Portunus trituberculatus]|uniref:Uncharacterized protein n=1 Tax=Portunus trituberculatus TaxID=210409 RepID=A0A5B7FWT6_PORTR|nr:hypothetical protein [Portunus trituberculatus]
MQSRASLLTTQRGPTHHLGESESPKGAGGREHRPSPLLSAGRLSLSLPSAEHGWAPAPLKPAFDSCSDSFDIY